MQIINDESDRLTRLINDVLDLSKMQSGKMQWKTEEISIVNAINKSIATTRPLIEKASLDLVPDIDSGLLKVSADPDKLIQVVTNIIGNAIKFTHEGGKIIIRAYQELWDTDGRPCMGDCKHCRYRNRYRSGTPSQNF